MVNPTKSPSDNPQNGTELSPENSTDASNLSDLRMWLTREESARLLGVAVQTIKNYEKRGLLCPQRVPRKIAKGREQLVVVHDPRELAKVRGKLTELTRREESTASKKRKATITDTSIWLTRNESADVLGVSQQTLKNYEERGILHPIQVRRRDARGREQNVVVYDPQEIAKVPRGLARPFSPREPGEINARCYELFEQGRTFNEIVIELRLTSDKVHEWYERWLDDSRASLVLTVQARTALEKLLGPFTGITELVSLVQQLKASVALPASAAADL